MLEIIGTLVNKMNEHTIIEYSPQLVVTDVVDNFWLKRYEEKILLALSITTVEDVTKGLYRKTHPNAEEELLKNFAADVTFHLVFRLSEQGRNE